MELLILGIDGGDRKIIERMDMPFIQSLLNKRVDISINEDLFSRGWGELATGLHGTETGAFYNKPTLQNTFQFSQGYSTEDYYKNKNCKPLWDALNEKGKSVGFINLPTTIPAPKVNGFFISGAGSGHSPASRVPSVGCYPQEIADYLLEKNFIWEQRFSVSGIKDFDLFIEKSILAVQQRNEVFVDLDQKYKVDVGFVMHKEFTLLVNLFMFHIQQLIDNPKKHPSPMQRRIMNFYRVFDDSFKVAYNKINPEHLVVISDHSARPYRYSLNLNHFLGANNYLKVNKNKERRNFQHFKSKLVRKAANKLLPHLGHSFENNIAGWEKIGQIDFNESLAFSSRYVPGIYINDERFSGKVGGTQKDNLVKEVISKLNGSREFKTYDIRASEYKNKYADSFAFNYLPDIWIDLPENVFPEQEGEFLQENPYYQNFSDLKNFDRDILSGMKGRNALCFFEEEFTSGIDLLKQYNLTVAYQLIVNHFQN